MDDNIKLEFTFEDENESIAPQAPQDEPVTKPARAPEAPKSPKVEFTVPESYSDTASEPRDEQDRTESAPIDTTLVHTTYLPRFTDASESYRMASPDEPRKTEAKPPKRESPKPHPTSSVDPTAEMDTEHALDGATVVTVGTPTPEEYDISSTVFKFDTTEEDDTLPTAEELTTATEEETAEAEEEVTLEFEAEEEGAPEAPITAESLALEEKKPGPVSRLEAITSVGDETDTNTKKKTEYTEHTQREAFKDKFLDTVMSLKVRLVASAVIAVLLLVLENLSLFGVDAAQLLGISSLPYAMALLDGQLVICLFVLALPEIIYAFRRLFVGRAVPELFIPAAAIVLVGYYAAVIIASPAEYALFGLLFALITLGAISAALYKTLADFTNFKKIATPEEKSIVDRKLTRSLPEENLAVDGKVEGYKSKTARIFRASFIADFFKRSGKCAESSGNVIVTLAATFGLGFVAACVAYFIPGGIFAAISTFTAVFIFGLPAFSLLVHKLPFFHAVKQAEKDGGAIIGETSLYDYSGVDVIGFDDTEVFGEEDVTLQRIMLYGKSENLSKAMHQMASVFSVVGGPLKNLFADSLDHIAPPADRVHIEEEGISGRVDGNEVRAGSLEYMVRNGITVPYDPAQERPLFSTKVMYAAENGEVYAKFYIRYTFSEEFTMLLPSLEDEGIVPLVYTRDPNVNNELLCTLTAGADKIRVLKKQTLPKSDDTPYSRVSAGIVTSKSKEAVINMLLLSRKYTSFQKKMAAIELAAMSFGSVLALVLAFSGITVIPTVALSLWHICWTVALAVMSRRTFNLPEHKQ
ncbi:MAG: hypothetical protein IJ515_01770 [Clostridia bacterium]|nr:hypothetical protein [Clostridia bacterium]